jgi:hypothetical protein
LDVALREDACKIHRAYAAENLARVRHIALNYLKGETSFKGGSGANRRKWHWMKTTLPRFSRSEMFYAFSLTFYVNPR